MLVLSPVFNSMQLLSTLAWEISPMNKVNHCQNRNLSQERGSNRLVKLWTISGIISLNFFVLGLGCHVGSLFSQSASAQSSVGLGPYWIGMSYADFERSRPPEKWSPNQRILPQVSIRRDEETRSMLCCFGPIARIAPYERNSPNFQFFKTDPASDYRLIAIYGSMDASFADESAKALRSRFGTPKVWQPLNIHGRYLYEWQVGETQIKVSPGPGPFATLQYLDNKSFSKYQELTRKRDSARVLRLQQESAATAEAENNEYQRTLTAVQNRKDEAAKLVEKWIQSAQIRAGNDTASRSVDDNYGSAIRSLPKPKLRRQSFIGGSFSNEVALRKEGERCVDIGNSSQTIDIFTKLYAVEPENSSYALTLANAERQAGRLDLAEQHFREAISLGEGCRAWLGLGIVRAEKGRHTDAVTCFLIANRHSSGTGIDRLKSDPSINVQLAYLEASSYIWPSQAQDYRDQLNRLRASQSDRTASVSETGVIGLRFSTRRAQLPVIDSVEPGFSAAAAGIVAGDELAQIDGKSTLGLGVDEIKALLLGKVGTSVNIKLSNGLTVSCVRKSAR